MKKLFFISLFLLSTLSKAERAKVVDLILEIEETVGTKTSKALVNIKAELNRPFSYADKNFEYYGEYLLEEENGKIFLNSKARKLTTGEHGPIIRTIVGEKGSVESRSADGQHLSISYKTEQK